MAESEYTKGFHAGMVWREAGIVDSLEKALFETNEVISKEFADGAIWAVKETIALIKGESKPFITTKQAEELTNEMLEE